MKKIKQPKSVLVRTNPGEFPAKFRDVKYLVEKEKASHARQIRTRNSTKDVER
jgi:hypothetical protein